MEDDNEFDGNDDVWEDELREREAREELEAKDGFLREGSGPDSSEDEQEGLPLPDQAYFQDRRKVITFTKSDVLAMLERDDACRKVQHWPLMSYEEMCDINQSVKFVPDDAEMLVNNRNCSPMGEQPCDSGDLIDKLFDYFPSMDQIFTLGGGHLVLAGGAVSMASQEWHRGPVKDADWFFFDHEEESNGNVSLITIDDAEATIRKIVEWWLSRNENPDDVEFYVTRNAHVTTLFSNDVGETHQLIHRIYPNKSAVIGGFDLAPCSVLYDGKCVYATELGAFSIISGYFCPDVSRQSFSFDHRIYKYARKGFTPIFLVKSEKEIREEFPIEEGKSYRVIRVGAHVRYLFLSDRCFMSASKYSGMQSNISDYDNGQEFNPYAVDKANTLMAALGKIEMMVWGGHKLEDVYGPGMVMPNMNLNHFKDYWMDIFEELQPIGQREALFRWFGKDFLEVNLSADQLIPWAIEHLPLLMFKIAQNFEIVKTTMGVIKWLGVKDNPSRQRFTSSIHPIDETVAWYNPVVRKVNHIGIPFNVCCTLLKGWKSRECYLNMVPKDVFRLLMRYIRRGLATSPFAKWKAHSE